MRNHCKRRSNYWMSHLRDRVLQFRLSWRLSHPLWMKSTKKHCHEVDRMWNSHQFPLCYAWDIHYGENWPNQKKIGRNKIAIFSMLIACPMNENLVRYILGANCRKIFGLSVMRLVGLNRPRTESQSTVLLLAHISPSSAYWWKFSKFNTVTRWKCQYQGYLCK